MPSLSPGPAGGGPTGAGDGGRRWAWSGVVGPLTRGPQCRVPNLINGDVACP